MHLTQYRQNIHVMYCTVTCIPTHIVRIVLSKAVGNDPTQLGRICIQSFFLAVTAPTTTVVSSILSCHMSYSLKSRKKEQQLLKMLKIATRFHHLSKNERGPQINLRGAFKLKSANNWEIFPPTTLFFTFVNSSSLILHFSSFWVNISLQAKIQNPR